MSKKFVKAEYIWLDGTIPTQEVRSKARLVPIKGRKIGLETFPEWGFDGSSTGQAEGHDSDCALIPVFFCPDPMREEGDYIVLCEVYTADKKPHPTNKRALLREALDAGGRDADAYIGFEQEYTLFKSSRPLGWPKEGYPAPQGPFYCGVGANKIFGRDIVDRHLDACLRAGLLFYGINAEVMPGQWEFQMGHRGDESEISDPLTISDHMWVGRYLLHRIAENYGVNVSFENKPVKGDWNGAGMHTNFSTKETRNSSGGMKFIQEAVERLKATHLRHIQDYGFGLADRLTGEHETCSIDEFKSGVSNRGASIRIPMATAHKGCGYFEDRRPGANADPYLVATRLLETVCQLDLSGGHKNNKVA